MYFTYGLHHCANVVTGAEGDGQAVLLRAVVPLEGIEVMRQRRRGVPERHLVDGPAKLCQAWDLDVRHDGLDLISHPEVWIGDDGTEPPPSPTRTPRIGIRVGTDRWWRFTV
jgi:DNA-3-methyladenine glycosylase